NEGVEIRMNTSAVGIKTEPEKITSVALSDGSSIPCDAVFSTMPIKDLVAAADTAPADVKRIAADLPYRDFMTVGLLVDKLAIKNTTKIKTVNNIVPDTWIYIQERDVRIGRIQIFNNWSPYMVDDVSKHVWLGLEYFCTEGDNFWTMDDAAFIDMAIKELRQIGILDENAPIHKSVRIKVKKAYPAYFGSYAEFGKVREWLDTFSNLYCIGRNGQHRYNNMDHSMLCAIEAVRALLGETDKATIWKVNTENDYHEGR
ncbi:MAG: FAD-dependent oxidoreductase, partial [Victivallales bacterium]|nr:FAD-dependent oxidoreductase [Victivallales bacterium]